LIRERLIATIFLHGAVEIISFCNILTLVNVISKTALRDFWNAHPEAESSLLEWYKVMQRIRCNHLNDLHSVFPSADYVRKKDLELTVFNVGGNNYRIICGISYRTQTVFIKYVLSHREYTQWSKRS
jgi:mRNA interferase HigB